MIFKLETPYDYHQASAILVKARSKKEAVVKLLKKYPESDQFSPAYFVHKPNLEDRLMPYVDDIYVDEGCDC